MWVNFALKKHDLALFQRTISQKPGFSGFSRAPRKITQQKEAHSGVLRADRGVPTGDRTRQLAAGTDPEYQFHVVGNVIGGLSDIW